MTALTTNRRSLEQHNPPPTNLPSPDPVLRVGLAERGADVFRDRCALALAEKNVPAAGEQRAPLPFSVVGQRGVGARDLLGELHRVRRGAGAVRPPVLAPAHARGAGRRLLARHRGQLPALPRLRLFSAARGQLGAPAEEVRRRSGFGGWTRWIRAS